MPPPDYPYYIHNGSPSFQVKIMFCKGYNYKSMNLTKPKIYAKGYTNYYMCIKSKSSNIKNDLRNGKKVQIPN